MKNQHSPFGLHSKSKQSLPVLKHQVLIGENSKKILEKLITLIQVFRSKPRHRPSASTIFRLNETKTKKLTKIHIRTKSDFPSIESFHKRSQKQVQFIFNQRNNNKKIHTTTALSTRSRKLSSDATKISLNLPNKAFHVPDKNNIKGLIAWHRQSGSDAYSILQSKLLYGGGELRQKSVVKTSYLSNLIKNKDNLCRKSNNDLHNNKRTVHKKNESVEKENNIKKQCNHKVKNNKDVRAISKNSIETNTSASDRISCQRKCGEFSFDTKALVFHIKSCKSNVTSRLY